MSQNLKQNSFGRKMLQHFCRCLMGLGMAVALWNSSLFIPLAQADIVVYKANFDDSYGAFNDEKEKEAVENALAYVSSILSNGEGAYHEINIRIDKQNSDMDINDLAHANYTHISINPDYKNQFSYVTPTQRCFSNRPDGKKYNLTSILIHEMGHSLGLLSGADNDGVYWFKIEYPNNSNYDDHLYHIHNLWITSSLDSYFSEIECRNNNENGRMTGEYTFRGETTNRVYNDGGSVEYYVEVENGQSGSQFWKFDKGSSITHPYTEHGIMNATAASTNRPFYSEVELAMLIDVGNKQINLKDHFGQSYYQSHGAITNTNGFNSNAIYGVGLHVIAANNQVTQAANINANGDYGTGIYSEGNNNAIIINPGVTVSATGKRGIGVLFIYNEDLVRDANGNIVTELNSEGKEVNKTKKNKALYLTNMGTIQVAYGTAVYVDKNLDTINNTGTIIAYTNAVEITSRGSVSEFNIMGNSYIRGDISGKIENLNFGKVANADGTQGVGNDPYFNGTVDGDIQSSKANMTVFGGYLNLTGSASVYSLSVGTGVGSNATIDGNNTGVIILNADDDEDPSLNYGTIKNFDSISTKKFNNDGNISNTATINSKELKNNGNISDVSTIASTYLHNNGNISNVSTIRSLHFYNTDTGSMTNVSTVNADLFLSNRDINIGEAGGIGTMNVNGSMQNNSGTLNIDTNLQAAPVSGTTADLISVKENGTAGAADGKLIINGGQVNVNELNSTGSSYYRADINHNIIETENGVVVNSELTAKETGFDIPLFKPVIGYDDKNVWLSLQRDFLYGPAAQTENQAALGYYLDEIGKTPNPDGDLFPVLLQLDSLNADKETGIVSQRALLALEEMSGAIYGTVTSLANQHATMVNNSLAKHLREWSPCDFTVSNWDLWAEVYGMGGNAIYDGNANGYNYSAAGTIIGIGRQFNIDGRIGLYFAVGGTDASIKGLSESAQSTDIFAGLYLNFKDSIGWYTTIFAGLGFSDYDVERNFSFIPRNNKSNFDSRQFNIYLERGRNYSISNVWVFQPFGGLQFIGSDRDRIQENGADLLDLTVAGTSMKSLRSLFGFKLATVNCVTGRKLNGEISAAWMHEYLDTNSIVSAQMSNPGGAYFESSPTYTVQGHDGGRDWLVAGIGLNYAFTDYFKLFGGYDCMVNGIGALHKGNFGLEIRR